MFARRAMMGAAGNRAFSFDFTLSTNQDNFNWRSALLSNGWDGVQPVKSIVTMTSSILLGSSSTGTFAFDTGSIFPDDSDLLLIIGSGCRIYGRGGAAGGGAGGSALRAQTAMRFQSSGTVASAGNGGGNGGGATGGTQMGSKSGDYCDYNCGASGGSGGTGAGSQNNGSASGGSGGSCCGNGICFVCGSSGATGGSLGAGSGYCILGTSFITYDSNGTRLGTIA